MDKSINHLKKSANIVAVVERVTNQNLKRKGGEFVGFCPFHKDDKPSLMVNEKKQVFGCFACQTKGDVIDFLTETFQNKGSDQKTAFKEALDYLRDQSGHIAISPIKQAQNKKYVAWNPLAYGPAPSTVKHYRHGIPNNIYKYKNADGKLIGLICRFDFSDGTKEVIPFSYCTNGTKKEWRWLSFGRPRPLYNWDKIVARPKATVLIVEGEKTADAAEKLYPHVVVTTWPGGTNAIHFVNWDILKNRNILLWPDNDIHQKYGEAHPKAGQIKPFAEQPGNKAMLTIYETLKTSNKVIKWIKNSKDFPHKWDVADANWTTEEAIKYAQSNVIDVPTPEQSTETKTEDVEPVEKEDEEPPPPPPEQPRASLPVVATNTGMVPVAAAPEFDETTSLVDHLAYFTFLGYEKETDTVTHCLYVKESRTVQKYTAGKMARISTLISLAPLDFWEGMFRNGRSKKVSIDQALNWAIRSSHAKGFFSSDSLRGRGAWMDDGRVVFHAGDHLIVDNRRVALGDLQSRYIYEAGPTLSYDISTPLPTAKANKLVSMLKLMNWSREINAYLLAGWCVVAPVCGALRWRPHIWITGGAGSGKSWTLKEVIRVLLGGSALPVQAETTEPGLRQLIKSDALPVVFDEADAEDFEQMKSIKKVLGLMRAASADDGGFLVKGSSSGSEKKYRIRSCFSFASIGVNATQQSDRTRITLLSLNTIPDSPQKKERWAALQKAHVETLTERFGTDLQARTIKLLPVIIHNADVFSKAAAALLGEQRVGDQVGALLAGAYSLSSSNRIDYDTAVKWIKNKDWSEERELDETRDENRLLNHLLERMTRVDRIAGAAVERTIGELVGIALQYTEDSIITDTSAERRLNQLGFKIYTTRDDGGLVKGNYLAVSNSSGHIKKFLFRTPWVNNWHKVLARIDNAIEIESTYFTVGSNARAIGIPIELITNTTKKEPQENQDLPF